MTALYVSSPAAFQTFGTNLLDGFRSVAYEQDVSEEPNDPNRVVLVEELSTPVDIIKDPTGSAVVAQEANSIGADDEREPAYLHQRIFDPVGELANGCTATYVEIPDYQAVSNDRIIVTAAHCVDDGVTPVFHGNYAVEENGQWVERSYDTVATEVWIHPFYESFRQEVRASERAYTPYDIAILRVGRDSIPSEVQPANLQIIDYSNVGSISFILEEGVSNLGYSADRDGLTYHPNCNVTELTFRDFQTDCDLSGGASGGNLARPFDSDGDESLTIWAINGGTHSGTEYARHSFFEANMLSMVPFVVPIEGGEPAQCAQVATETSNLNRRFEPNLDGRPLSSEEQSHFGALPRHSLVQVFGSINGWDLVQPIDGNGIKAVDDQFGYSSAQYLTPYPCPAR